MLIARPAALLVCLSATLILAGGCITRNRVIKRGVQTGPVKPLTAASQEVLIRRITEQYEAIRSFSAGVDLTPALGSVYKGQITEYQDVSGYVLYRQPHDIRVIGLAPVVRTKVFDMVSTGEDFRILIPTKNRFVEGRNDAPPTSSNSVENLRPEAFLESMLVSPPDLTKETPFLVDNTDENEAVYVLVFVHITEDRKPVPVRAVFIDRTTMYVVRQKRYLPNGDIVSDTRYHDFAIFNGISFPKTIDISRPKDAYGVAINIRTLEMNKDLSNDRFVLEQPAGTQLQVIGASTAAPANGPSK